MWTIRVNINQLKIDICGMIKQNQSEVGQIKFSFVKLFAPFSQLRFAENPIEIGQFVPKIQAVEECQKQ